MPEKDSGDDYTALEYTKNSNKNTELHALKWWFDICELYSI